MFYFQAIIAPINIPIIQPLKFFSAAISPSSPALGLKTPPTFGSKTPPVCGQSIPAPSVLPSSSNLFSQDSPSKKKDQENSKIPSSSTTLKSGQNTGDQSPISKENNSNNDRKKVEKIKEQLRKEREKNANSSTNIPKTSSRTDIESNEKSRKVFPELPVSKCDGDKIEQHRDDYAVTKRRLEEARARKMADIHRKKEIDR